MMGPIPMGYQLAKDPMTGQILLIPTDPAAAARPPPPPPPGSGLYPYDPPTSASGPTPSQLHHHMMLQQHYLHDKQQVRNLEFSKVINFIPWYVI